MITLTRDAKLAILFGIGLLIIGAATGSRIIPSHPPANSGASAAVERIEPTKTEAPTEPEAVPTYTLTPGMAAPIAFETWWAIFRDGEHFFGENDDNPSTPYVRCTETYCEHGYHFLSTEEGRTTGEFRVFELRNKDGKPIGHQMCITSTPPNYTAFCTDYDNWWKLSTVGDRHYAERPNEQTRNKTIETRSDSMRMSTART